MKTVGLVTTSLNSDHQVRGIGSYLELLTKNIAKHLKTSSIQYRLISNTQDIYDSSIDIIHYPFFELFNKSLVVPDNKKIIVTVHDVIPLELPEHYPPGIKGKINLFFQKKTLSTVNKIITDSSASASSIVKYLGIPHDKISVVYLAVDNSFYKIRQHKLKKLIKDKYQLPDNFILYVGDINYNKNLPTLAYACEQLNIQLVVVGKSFLKIGQLDLSHPELNHLQKINWEKINKLGFISKEDLNTVYNLATAYCQPSFSEGFGLPVLEAMSCGTPVLCSKSHSLLEIAGIAGIYFESSAPSSLIQIMKKIIDDDKTRKMYSLMSLEQSKKFTIKNMASEMDKIYNNI